MFFQLVSYQNLGPRFCLTTEIEHLDVNAKVV